MNSAIHGRLNRALTILFAVCLAVQAAYLTIGLASLPAYYQRVTTQAIEPVYLYGQDYLTNAIVGREASERSLPLASFALYNIALRAVGALVPAGLSVVILWRAGRNWFAWFTAFIVVFLSQTGLMDIISIARLIPPRFVGGNDLFWFLGLLYLFLFPDGQVVPRRLGWVALALVVYHFVIQACTVVAEVFPEAVAWNFLPNWGQPIFVAPVLLNFVIILVCQIYRYRHVSGPVQKLQTKWFVFSLALIILLIPEQFVTGNRGGFIDDLLGNGAWWLLTTALTVSILRYRLWDIDILIRRTLVYSILTALLALVYFGSVLSLQSAFTGLTGQGSPIALVVSTLAIAVLFLPLRARIQTAIDKHFYRRKYNAAQALADFSAAARDETDLSVLNSQLINVVRDAMEPESVGIWIRSTSSQ